VYSPKIKEDLIPILYRLANEKDKPMTRVVDEILRKELVVYEQQKEVPHCVSCYSKLDLDSRKVTAYCKLCRSETFVLYIVPTGSSDSFQERR
jgi:hypothetical protein